MPYNLSIIMLKGDRREMVLNQLGRQEIQHRTGKE